ncbi:MAG: acyloxyacyl hydrolase [Phycisphaerales bacterium]|nr:MAG: acyloxyacyl hydrolase [Phycisphaerales bacterium]
MSLTLLTALTTVAMSSLQNTAVAGQCDGVERLEFRFAPAAAEPVVSLVMMADEQVEEPPAIEPAPPPFGTAESWRIYLHGGAGLDVKDSDNKLGQLGVGFEYFIADDLSLDFEFNGLYVSQVGDNALAANFALLFRYHFISEPDWSMYLDGGAGLLGSSSDAPQDGSSFNFTPQAGFGMTYNIGDNNRLMGGLRWHHISNAHTHEQNPGRDSIMLYLGLSMPF